MEAVMIQGQYTRYDYWVSEEKVGYTLARFLIEIYGYSSRLLRRIKAVGMMSINGKDCWLSSFVHLGDHIEVAFPKEKTDAVSVEGYLSVIYEDDELLVVNKDAGCVTHPTKRHQEDTLANRIAFYYDKTGQSAKIRFISRLDMDTTGVLAVAKNKYVQHFLQSASVVPPIKKSYMAFVHGLFDVEKGCVEAPIGRFCETDILRQVMSEGKPSVTHYEVVEQYPVYDAALIRLYLETGRTHQIRVHMQHIGHPVVGDVMYCPENLPKWGMTRQALHSAETLLTLPTAGRVRLKADFKPDMMQLWRRFREKFD